MASQRDIFKDTKDVDDAVFDEKLAVTHADDVKLAELGYKSEFKREFSVSITKSLSFACAQ